MIDLTKLRALLDAATPGPWMIEREELSVDFDDEEQACAYPERVGPFGPLEHAADVDDPERVEADVALVADLRNLAPELLAELEETRRALGDAERERDRLARRVEVLEADRAEIVRLAGGRTP